MDDCIKYENDKLFNFLKKIKGNCYGFIKPSNRSIDAIMIDQKSKFFRDMPFNTKQYVFIQDGCVTISTNYDTNNKHIANDVTTRRDFFRTFSKLKIEDINDQETIIEFFPNDYGSYWSGYNSDDIPVFPSYTPGLGISGGSSGDIVWNEDLETFTME